MAGLTLPSSTMKLLDLYCGGGGASDGYVRAGFTVTGVDIVSQRYYPYPFIQMNALDVDFFREFDVIHASPPCQAFTAYKRREGWVKDSADLIDETRLLLESTGLPYVIENIPNAPLVNPVQLCGSSFGLDVRRHRIFESNLDLVGKPCDHKWQTPRFAPASNRTNLRSTVEIGVGRIPMEIQLQAMGFDRPISRRSLTEALPPAYTEWLGTQILSELSVRNSI
jgi:DNA (cytosine-5)-methyltransferase 1